MFAPADSSYRAALARQNTFDALSSNKHERQQDYEPRSSRPSFHQPKSHRPQISATKFTFPADDSQIQSAAPPRLSLQRKSWAHMRKQSTSVPSEPQGPSHYYQDPEARRQLKNCLASPDKFDEAVRFGFPTGVDPDSELYNSRGFPREVLHQHRKSASRAQPGRASSDLHRFFRNDTLDFLDEPDSSDDEASETYDDDDYERQEEFYRHGDESETDTESPITPQIQFEHRPQIMPSYGMTTSPPETPVGCIPQFHRRTDSKNWQSHFPGNHREMTIRMTLTRPELRDEEDATPYKQGFTGPYPTDDGPFEEDEGFEEQGKVRRMLRRMTIGRK